MQQYREIKSRHQDAILFFRMGEFYEMFYEDAEVASRALGLTLTSRNNGGASEVPLAGVPVKAAGEYLRRLIQQGFRVSICEQTEDPKFAKGIVRREVVETITPGAAFSDDLLDGSRNNYLCALNREADVVGIAAVDLSTGELRLAISPVADLESALSRFTPGEVIVARGSNLVHALKGASRRRGPDGNRARRLGVRCRPRPRSNCRAFSRELSRGFWDRRRRSGQRGSGWRVASLSRTSFNPPAYLTLRGHGSRDLAAASRSMR